MMVILMTSSRARSFDGGIAILVGQFI
jgi:hypothetical protein